MGAALLLGTLANIFKGPGLDLGVLVVGDRPSVGFPLVVVKLASFTFCTFVLIYSLEPYQPFIEF